MELSLLSGEKIISFPFPESITYSHCLFLVNNVRKVTETLSQKKSPTFAPYHHEVAKEQRATELNLTRINLFKTQEGDCLKLPFK